MVGAGCQKVDLTALEARLHRDTQGANESHSVQTRDKQSYQTKSAEALEVIGAHETDFPILIAAGEGKVLQRDNALRSTRD